MVLYHFNRYLLGLVSAYVRTYHRTEEFIKVFNTIAQKMVKVSKMAQRKLIPHRSIIGLGAFRKIKYFEIFPDSYCAYRDLTIKSELFKKHVFVVLLIQNINPTAEKSSEN